MSVCPYEEEENLNSDDQPIFQPGAARHGNFINYYSFNSVSKRLDVIPSNLLLQLNLGMDRIVCLDIGCNSGDLTLGLYSHLESAFEDKSHGLYMLGIDLDDVLITRSNESNIYRNCVTFKKLDIMEANATSELETFLQKQGKTKFDFISCFSTTMWIHLNHGDEGLEKFLKTISGITKYLLLEPQEWKSYKSAIRRMTRLNHEVFLIKGLKIRGIVNHTRTYLSVHCDMELDLSFGETSWGRKMYLFKSVDSKIDKSLKVDI